MKAAKVNTAITLLSKVTVKPGAIFVPSEVYYNLKDKKEIDGVIKIPTQISAPGYESVDAYLDGAPPVGAIEGYPAIITDNVIMKYYSVDPAETLAINVVVAALEILYPGNVEIIEI